MLNIIFFVFSVIQCDLIGFNRLGNNIELYHRSQSNNENSKKFEVQILRRLLANSEMTNKHKISILNELHTENNMLHQENSRYQQYRQRMARKL